MHHIRFLRSITLVFCLIFVIFGCATDKNRIINNDFEITAENVPEGILLHLNNVPPDVTHMSVHISRWSTLENPRNFVSSFTFFTEPSVSGWDNSNPCLDKIKQTSRIIFPFVEKGIEYSISVYIFNEHEYNSMRENDENTMQRMAFTNIIADNGIYFNKDDVKIEMNETYSEVTLSSVPVFSTEVIFDDQRYSFGVVIIIGDIGSIGVGDHHQPDGLSSDGLSWKFEPQMTENFRIENFGWLENGSNYTAWAEVYANLFYEDIRWNVGIVRTPDFIYSF